LADQLFADQLFAAHEFAAHEFAAQLFAAHELAAQLFAAHEFAAQLFADQEFDPQLLADHEFARHEPSAAQEFAVQALLSQSDQTPPSQALSFHALTSRLDSPVGSLPP
jgi:hypothetical protein